MRPRVVPARVRALAKASVCLLLLAAAAAQAEFNYSYASLSYGNVDIDDLNVDGDGLGAELSLAITESFHLLGSLEAADLDAGVDLSQWSAGIGYNAPLSPMVDVIGRVSYEKVAVDTPFADADTDGFGIGVGVRVELIGIVELNGGASFVDFDRGGDVTRIDAGVLINLTEDISLGVDASFDDDVNAYRLTGRFYF